MSQDLKVIVGREENIVLYIYIYVFAFIFYIMHYFLNNTVRGFFIIVVWYKINWPPFFSIYWNFWRFFRKISTSVRGFGAPKPAFLHFLGLPEVNKMGKIDKKYAKADIKVFCSCQILLDLFTFCQIFCPPCRFC